MTTALVKAEIERFLQSPLPEVLCVKGRWGVGKTFAWQQFLKQASSSCSVGLKHYAYVSLFGVSSLDALRNAILENSVASSQIADGPSWDAYESFIRGTGALAGKAAHFSALLGKKDAGDALARALFLSVNKRIVCIDDLERKGAALELRDVLGLASMLKEERQCKIVFLLNDEELSDENKTDFERLLEKVVDVSLVFEPTPEEAVEIAFQAKSPASAWLSPKIIKLGITNIRIIKKIERHANRLLEILSGYSDEVLEQAVSTAALGGWSVLDPGSAPPTEYIKHYNRDIEAIRAQREIPEADRDGWNRTIESFGFKFSDAFDVVIIEGIERGYFDDRAVKIAADEVVAALANNQLNNSFTRAWGRYHSSLTIDDHEILEGFFKGAMESLHLISPLHVNAVVILLRENGWERQASKLIEAYMSNRAFVKDALAEELRMWGREPVDPELEAAFKQAEEKFEDTRDPVEVMKNITAQSGWNPEDIDLLAKQSASDFERFFEAIQGDELPRVADFVVSLGRHEGDNYRALGLAVTEGLKRIAAKSPLRARRVASYGVDLNTDKNEDNVEDRKR